MRWKQALRRITPVRVLELRRGVLSWKQERDSLRAWNAAGRPAPPPHTFKQRAIYALGKMHRLDVFVETGTYLGEMVAAQRNNFRRIYSIELSRELCVRAQERFARDNHISIIWGDSGKVLPEILAAIHSPALFWLDGHYSTPQTAMGTTVTPIIDELSAIAASALPHVLLIDDARLFTGFEGYPSLATVRSAVERMFPRATFDLADDMITITPLR